ncbi:hypothetical protein [Endozoicomonas sp. ONNA2]|uniref:hypothetical protein n=1 Tax=Endozoicomonas sp. ONNA2 TaxID=2828741 RepID=UPI0021474997|nr:hypothetical protein [Endozoicomonas sp. ONNA2]
MEILRALKIVGLFILFCSSIAVAELPPHVYAEYRKTAPEKIEIFILKLTSTHNQSEYSTVTKISSIAKINKVFRSESNLSEGQTIKINYQRNEHGEFFVGPSQPIHLRTGKTYIAYLVEGEGFYMISAGGHSFITSDDYQKYYSDEESPEQ